MSTKKITNVRVVGWIIIALTFLIGGMFAYSEMTLARNWYLGGLFVFGMVCAFVYAVFYWQPAEDAYYTTRLVERGKRGM